MTKNLKYKLGNRRKEENEDEMESSEFLNEFENCALTVGKKTKKFKKTNWEKD